MHTMTRRLTITVFRYWGNLDWNDCRANGYFRRNPRAKFDVSLEDSPGPDTYRGTRIGEMQIETGAEVWSWSGEGEDSDEPSSPEGRLLLADLLQEIEQAIAFRRICAKAQQRAYYAISLSEDAEPPTVKKQSRILSVAGCDRTLIDCAKLKAEILELALLEMRSLRLPTASIPAALKEVEHMIGATIDARCRNASVGSPGTCLASDLWISKRVAVDSSRSLWDALRSVVYWYVQAVRFRRVRAHRGVGKSE
jgi:hypothetical protein